jgi:hypothetical protein
VDLSVMDKDSRVPKYSYLFSLFGFVFYGHNYIILFTLR